MKKQSKITSNFFVTKKITSVKNDMGIFHYKNSELLIPHKNDAPAIECVNGTVFFFTDGKLNRYNLPAIQYSDGSKFYYQNNMRHRTDGPAIEWANGIKKWYLFDKEYSEKDFNETIKGF